MTESPVELNHLQCVVCLARFCTLRDLRAHQEEENARSFELASLVQNPEGAAKAMYQADRDIGDRLTALEEKIDQLANDVSRLCDWMNEIMPAARQATAMLEKRNSLLKLVTRNGR